MCVEMQSQRSRGLHFFFFQNCFINQKMIPVMHTNLLFSCEYIFRNYNIYRIKFVTVHTGRLA